VLLAPLWGASYSPSVLLRVLKGYFRSYISERNVSQVFIPFCGLLVFVKICKALYLHILTGHLTDFQFVILVPAPDAFEGVRMTN
jgi:hypothetical protein